MSETTDERRSPDTLLPFDMEDYYSESSDEDEDNLDQYIDEIKNIYIDQMEKIIDSRYDEGNIELLITIIEESYDNGIDINDSNMKNLVNLMYIFYDRTRFNYINHIECIKEIFKSINTLNDIEKFNIDKEIKDMFDKINSVQITPNISIRV